MDFCQGQKNDKQSKKFLLDKINPSVKVHDNVSFGSRVRVWAQGVDKYELINQDSENSFDSLC